MARAIFTYASGVKKYGELLRNRVCVIGHSFGALLLERSLGQAMTGALTMEWWSDLESAATSTTDPASAPFAPAPDAAVVHARSTEDAHGPEAQRPLETGGGTKDALASVRSKLGLPFDIILFVNSAAPAIYAKEMRDFLKAHRSALTHNGNPAADIPVILSLTSTADQATGMLHPIGNILAPFSPSLQPAIHQRHLRRKAAGRLLS